MITMMIIRLFDDDDYYLMVMLLMIIMFLMTWMSIHRWFITFYNVNDGDVITISLH